MQFDSFHFLVFSLCAISLLRIVAPGRLRAWLLAVLNSYFLWSFARDTVVLVPLLSFVLFGYLVVRTADAKPSDRVLGVMISALIALFIWLKGYSVIASLPSLQISFVTVGLSYILFRAIHLIVDVSQGAAKPPTLLAYLNYVFFFLTYVSGPIQRFQDFVAQCNHPRPASTSLEMNDAIRRVIAGFFLIIVVCSITAWLNETLGKYLFVALSGASVTRTTVLFSAAALVQLIHLYANFVGYMNICIGLGCLAGYSLPENFDQPHRAKNFLDFWSRWHITLSEWFKFYLFNPFLKALMKLWGPEKAQYLGAIAFFVTFLTMGIWHGSTGVFVFYGLLLGLGVTANKLWQVEFTRRYGKTRYKQLCQSSWYSRFSNVVSLSYFAIVLSCIWIPAEEVNGMASLKGLGAATQAFVLLSALLYATSWLIERIILPLHRWLPQLPVGDRMRTVTTGFLLFLTINAVMVLGSRAPEFVYKAF